MNEEDITGKTLLELVDAVRIVGHRQAAKAQLEQALFLWFHKDHEYVVSEPTAIHTLTVAVQGVLWAYAHDSQQRPSTVKQKIEKMTPEQRASFVDARNFFEHGNVGRKEKEKRVAVAHSPDLTDFFLSDNVGTFNRLFRRSSPLMDTFRLHYSLSFPNSGMRHEALEMKLVSSGCDLKEVAALDRIGFYNFVLPYAVEYYRELRAAHGIPPEVEMQ